MKLVADEWENFLERVGCSSEEDLMGNMEEELRLWASYRGQTLTKTGMRIFLLCLILEFLQTLHRELTAWIFSLSAFCIAGYD